MSDAATRPQTQAQDIVRKVGDYAGPVALLCFGFALWYYCASENIFTFAAWGTLDILMGLSMYHAGAKKEARLPISYGVIAYLVVLIIYRNGQWQWTNAETICLVGTIAASGFWARLGATAGTIAFGAALTAASVPILITTYQNPQTWEWWLWVGSLISATAGLYLTRPWTLKNIDMWLFVWISEVVTVGMLALLLRPLLP